MSSSDPSTKMPGRAVVKYADESPSTTPEPGISSTSRKPRSVKELKAEIEALKRSTSATQRRYSETTRQARTNSLSGSIRCAERKDKAQEDIEEKLKRIRERHERELSKEKHDTSAIERTKIGARDDDIDVWNQGRRPVSPDVDFSVVAIDDESDSEPHTVPCGDLLCDRCTVVFSDFSDYRDGGMMPIPLSSRPKVTQISGDVGLDPEVGTLAIDPERQVYLTSPTQTTKIGASRDALKAYMRIRQEGRAAEKSLGKSQDPATGGPEQSLSVPKIGSQSSILSPLSEFIANIKKISADTEAYLDDQKKRRESLAGKDIRSETGSCAPTMTDPWHGRVDKGRRDADNAFECLTPITPIRPAAIATPDAPTKRRPGPNFQVEEQTGRSFRERMARSTPSRQMPPSIQSTPCRAEPVDMPRIGRGSRPPLSKSSCFNGRGTCQDPKCKECTELRVEKGEYFPYRSSKSEETTAEEALERKKTSSHSPPSR